MRKTQRLTAVGALAVVVASVVACGDRGKPASAHAGATTTATTALSTSLVAGNGITTVDDVFGPLCDQFPRDPEDKGSLQAMAAEPVGTAASNNPLLTTLGQLANKASLAEVLDAWPEMTVFAPADLAFAAAGTKGGDIPRDPELLRSLLSYHVVPQRYDREGLLNAMEVKTVQGTNVKIKSVGDSMTINDAPVLCGNMPTKNATVFVIGEVLQPPTG